VYSGKFSAIKKVTPKLAKATGLKSAKRSATSLKLSWKKTAGAKRYEVWRKAGSGKWAKVATTAKRSLTQKNLKRGVTYSYRVRACITVAGKKSYGAYSAAVKRRMG
jgi:lactocepin